MKYFYIIILLSLNLFAFEAKKDEAKKDETKYVANTLIENMSVSNKKKRFFTLLVPTVKKVHAEFLKQYINTLKDLQNGTNMPKIIRLKKLYKVSSDEELLRALKPHPKSITLAQAAMESSWATSRFFKKANNVFGVWSVNKKEARVAALEKRGGTKTVWLRKFNSIEDSVREYYKMMGRSKAFKEFREVRYESHDVYKIIKKLNNYSEIKHAYAKELAHVIRYNKLTKYD